MRVLLSAFACEPNKGSEFDIGWQWAIHLSDLEHDVWVLTNREARVSIEQELKRIPQKHNLKFIYYDVPFQFTQWKYWARLWPFERGISLVWYLWHYPYYYLWQYCAYRHVKRIHNKNHFDIVHHVTYAALKRPCFLGGLDAKFILGPVGGGERAPWRLRTCFQWHDWLLDLMRDFNTLIAKYNPRLWRQFKQAEHIYVTSPQSLNIIPGRFRCKAEVKLQLGIDMPAAIPCKENAAPNNDHLRFLYVGRLLYWKGMYYGIMAFSKLLSVYHSATLTIVGQGPEEVRLKKLAKTLGIESNIHWIPWTEQKQLPAIYQRHDVFLFPSLHDSGGLVVLEAMSNLLPVICLDLGGPGISVNSSCGIVIDTRKKSTSDVIDSLFLAMEGLTRDKYTLSQLKKGAFHRSQEFAWRKVVNSIYLPLSSLTAD